ncbi:MAG: twin-arginine translocation signal domain-containing protein [Slackia sp.]
MTKEQLGVSRRNFLKASGITAIGAFAVAGLTGCGQPKTASKETESAASTGPAFLQAPEPIVDFSNERVRRRRCRRGRIGPVRRPHRP